MINRRLSVYHRLVVGLILLASFFSLEGAEPISLESPNHAIRLAVQMPEPSDPNVRWSAAFRGKQILNSCELGLELEDARDLLKGAKLLRVQRRSVNERVTIPFGKSASANDRYQEARLALNSTGQRKIDVIFRCYDDAIALRYELLDDGADKSVTIREETTSFRVEGDPMAYVQVLENYTTSHEHHVTPTRYSDIRAGDLLDMPLTLEWSDGGVAAITEAGLRRYAGMALSRSKSSGTPNLVCKLTPRPDGTKVVTQLPLRTPWRVVLLGDRAGALLESNTLFCLNDPPAFSDLSWIKPGKTTFHWWNGDVYDGKPGLPILSFEMASKYIDFCARNGIQTHAMSSTEITTTPWYQQTKPGVEPGPDTDVTKPRAGFDLPKIKEYADSRGVRLWTWVHQKALRGRVEEAFASFERLGWNGMMVDFFDHDDQETVEFSEEVLKAAARHHILIHLHGVWKPTGLERTYPNLMNHEGALNLEYLKWSDACPPEHDLMMAFTRLVAGPMDYHLGGFRAVSRAAFKPQNVAPHVLGTRGHMLAMYVCFDNPNPMVADYPTAYEGQAGFDFLTLVPTWWDETRVIEGKIGELLVTARRKGKIWFVGGLSAKHPRDLNLPLSFLGNGRYAAKVWRDAFTGDPNQLVVENVTMSAKDSLKVRVDVDGGFVAEIAPAAE